MLLCVPMLKDNCGGRCNRNLAANGPAIHQSSYRASHKLCITSGFCNRECAVIKGTAREKRRG
jgi:hypothetical protein